MTTSAMSNRRGYGNATANCAPELVEAMAQMCEVGERPASLRWKLSDAARNRPMRPLGTFPEASETLALSGKSTFYRISRPLYVQLARLRQICGMTRKESLDDAMLEAKKESDEAEVCAFRLALSKNRLGASELHSIDKEATEAEEKWGRVKEIAEDQLAAMESK